MANTKISALTSATTPVAGTEVLPIVQTSATVKLAISDLTPGLSTISAAKGGTGQTSYAVGDLLYASTTTALSKLADVATGNALISGGIGVAPSYGKIGLTTHVSGVLPVANGGTNASSASITAFNNITGYTASGATGTTSTNLVFSTSPSITTPTLVGDVTASTGNVVIGTSGKGIDFSITSHPAGMTSELLADYEEGTWTPAGVLTTPGTSASSSVVGRYTKVGRIVTVATNFTFTKGTGTGNFSVSGLPYTVGSALVYTAVTLQCENVGSALNVVGAYANPSATNVQFILMPQGTTAASVLTDGALGATAAIRFSITYAT
jgi:hypothetical protein